MDSATLIVQPLVYHLTLEPHVASKMFSGSVLIELKSIQATKSITLHCVELNIKYVLWRAHNQGSGLPPAKRNCKYEQTGLELTIQLDEILQPHSLFEVEVEYTAALSLRLTGLYQSTYITPTGSEVVIIGTHMEPENARRVFPCFDSPSIKAKFRISAITRTDDQCLSNMPQVSETSLKYGRRLVLFETSLPMSTYLVALVIGKFGSISTETSRGIPIRLFSPAGQESRGKFALDICCNVLEIYEALFNFNYPLPKLDLVAVPDLAVSAMENWGLLLFRPLRLLLDEAKSDINDKKRISRVVAHEVAHQWFGNLVTMRSWEELWLKEGFATWLSHNVNNRLFPEWRLSHDHVSGTLQMALELDALHATHPVQVPLGTMENFDEIFDDIAYLKGASILHMLADIIGEEALFRGLKTFVASNAFSTASATDLWRALSAGSAGVDVDKLMTAWVSLAGFPVVSLHTERKQTSSTVMLILTQRRFSNLIPSGAKTRTDTVYPIHIRIRTPRAEYSLELLQRTTTIQLDDPGPFKLNSDQRGFYRVSYDYENLTCLASAAKDGWLSPDDLLGIIGDSLAFTAVGEQSTVAFLKLLELLQHDDRLVVWQYISKALDRVFCVWRAANDRINRQLGKWMLSIFLNRAWRMKIDWSHLSSNVDQDMEALMFEQIGAFGDERIIAMAHRIYEPFALGNRAAIPSAYRRAVFRLVAEKGTKEEFRQLLYLSQTAPSEDDRHAILSVLGFANDKECLDHLIQLLDQEWFKVQNIPLIFAGMQNSAAGIHEAWSWTKKNWEKIEASFSPGLLHHLLEVLISGLTSEQQLEEVKEFFNVHDTRSIQNILAAEIEKLQVRIQWCYRDTEELEKFLNAEHS